MQTEYARYRIATWRYSGKKVHRHEWNFYGAVHDQLLSSLVQARMNVNISVILYMLNTVQ